MKYTVHTEIEQGTDEWLTFKRPFITGTDAKRIMGTKFVAGNQLNKYIGRRDKIVPEIYTALGGAAQRGLDLEPEARGHGIVKWEEVGFISSSDESFETGVGVSPDGILRDDKGTVIKACEIKCLGEENHIRSYVDNSIHKDFISQCIHYFVVIDTLEELVFIIYNPDLGKFKYKEIKVKRSEIEQQINLQKDTIISFQEKVIAVEKELREMIKKDKAF